MARTDTLSNFLTDVAGAIRSKAGTSGTIQASSFDTAIANIPTGSTTYEYDDVTIFDYDGTIIWSGKKAAFLAMTAYPTQPTHTGLTNEGYNIALADAKEFVTKYGVLNIGAQYSPTDDKEHIHIHVPKDNTTLYLRIYCYSKNLYIDWGDGSTEEHKTASATSEYHSHTFATAGDYIVKIHEASYDAISITGMDAYDPFPLVYDTSNKYTSYNSAAELITSIVASSHYRLSDNFSGLRGLKSLCIAPRSDTYNTTTFAIDATGLEYLTIPHGLWCLPTCSADNAHLKHISISNSVCRIERLDYQPLEEFYLMKPDSNSGFYKNWNNNMVANNNRYLKKVIVDGWYEFSGSSATNSLNNFQNTYYVEYVAIPGINYVCNCFSNSYKLKYLKIGKNFSGSLGMSNFSKTYALDVLDLTDAVAVMQTYPLEMDVDARRKIVVPDNLYSSWIADPNWSAYASQIVSASDYFGS